MRRTMLTLTVLALFATGCGGEAATQDGSTETETSTPTEETTPATDPSPTDTATTEAETEDEAAEAPFTANTEEDTADGSGDPVTVSDVRVEAEEDFDRVVFEIAGEGTPGWRVGYVDEATEQGRGNEVEMEGDAVLEVTVTNTSYPFDTGEDEYDGPKRIDGAEVVAEAYFVGTFEGQTQAFVGTTSERPFRARLTDDGNIAVEVWHEDVEG